MHKDDLKQIHGIGPVFEHLLNEMGYLSFHDISSWSETDIIPVAKRLGAFPERIKRDDWIGQARHLEQTAHS